MHKCLLLLLGQGLNTVVFPHDVLLGGILSDGSALQSIGCANVNIDDFNKSAVVRGKAPIAESGIDSDTYLLSASPIAYNNPKHQMTLSRRLNFKDSIFPNLISRAARHYRVNDSLVHSKIISKKLY